MLRMDLMADCSNVLGAVWGYAAIEYALIEERRWVGGLP